MKITEISARQILDSRGNPTISVKVFSGSEFGEFSIPSGASTGSFEAVEKRDGDKNYFRGKGVLNTVKTIEGDIAKALIGTTPGSQSEIDEILIKLDGTENKSNLGGNATIGVSIACSKLAANLANVPLYKYLQTLTDIKKSRQTPLLFMNVINGGLHAKSRLSFQEYMIVPQIDSVDESLNSATLILNDLKNLIVDRLGSQSANIGDEGGFVLDTSDVFLPLELLTEVIAKNNLKGKVKLALDVASSSFYKNGMYSVGVEKLSAQQILELYRKIVNKYDVLSIEDPFFEEDFESFAKLHSDYEGLVVGDDLTVTNKKRLQIAIDKKSINAIIIKPNQIGTLTQTLETIKLARENDIECIVSHRSGETNDDFIADLSFAFGCFGLKSGAPQRGERVAKYNRLSEISSQV